MQEALYLIPEAFDEELLAEAAEHLDDPDVVFVAGDLAEDIIFDEDEAVAVLANYGQVRSFLDKRGLVARHKRC